jgi:DNA-binding NarL/FixJ family response regulator/signal transduction histidine kinase
VESTRWWHVAVLGVAAVLAGLVVWNDPTPTELWGALACIAAFVIGWLVVGRRAPRSDRAAFAFVVITIAVASVGTAFSPNLATLQCIAYPIIWVMLDRTQHAILANIALATGVGVGLYLSTGSALQALLIQAISVTFSIALGLWITSIAVRSHERQRLLDELRATQDQLAIVSRDAGVASERERLAREIHDTIAQDLTGLVLLTQRARRELPAGELPALTEQLALLEDSARSALAETRALVATGAPVGLATGGIGEALERLGSRFARETGVQVGVDAAGLGPLGRDTEVVLLRCAQEGLANVRKHANASTASLIVSVEGGHVSLTVRDDGAGFDPEGATAGFGLSGMRERPRARKPDHRVGRERNYAQREPADRGALGRESAGRGRPDGGAAVIRVLVADDHPIVRGGIVALLESADDLSVVGEATTGLEAVALAFAHEPDIVLMDLQMPELGGAEATARILEQRPGIRVIVLTTYESDSAILTAIEAGASGYLLKAAPAGEILAGIRSVAAGDVALAPSIATMLVNRVKAPAGPTLSARETEVLALVAQGASNPAIAKALFVSEATVKTHLLHVFEKLEVSDRTRAVTRAMELGLL